MFPGRVIGRVVATAKDDNLEGKKLLVVQPTDWDGAEGGQPLVALDAVGAGAGEWIFYVKSREAAVAFPDLPVTDAAIVGIIDGVQR